MSHRGKEMPNSNNFSSKHTAHHITCKQKHYHSPYFRNRYRKESDILQNVRQQQKKQDNSNNTDKQFSTSSKQPTTHT